MNLHVEQIISTTDNAFLFEAGVFNTFNSKYDFHFLLMLDLLFFPKKDDLFLHYRKVKINNFGNHGSKPDWNSSFYCTIFFWKGKIFLRKCATKLLADPATMKFFSGFKLTVFNTITKRIFWNLISTNWESCTILPAKVIIELQLIHTF